jgi:hypothetical protein
MICKFAPCHILEICKYRDEELEEGNVRHPKEPKITGLQEKFSTSPEDLKIVRQRLSWYRKDGKLGEAQIKALKTTQGKHYHHLTNPQKEQLLSIYQDVLKGEKH